MAQEPLPLTQDSRYETQSKLISVSRFRRMAETVGPRSCKKLRTWLTSNALLDLLFLLIVRFF